MEFLEHVKSMTREQVANTMISLLPHVSPDTFMKLSILASRLVEGEAANSAAQAVKASLQEGENVQAARMFKRVMIEVSPHCLQKIGKTLFINGLLKSTELRRRFEREQGFVPPFTLLISPTMGCNLQCIGCYSGRYVREKGLPFELLDRIIGEAREMGILFIVFSGGEPLTDGRI